MKKLFHYSNKFFDKTVANYSKIVCSTPIPLAIIVVLCGLYSMVTTIISMFN